MSRILMSGASGFIGGSLFSFLISEGHEVIRLTRRGGEGTIQWDPEKAEGKRNDFENFDAVIHLAGEPLTLSRWSKEKREKILHSRVFGTLFLSHLLNALLTPPKVFICASAVGYYGDRGEERVTEESASGRGFLAHVCCAWEKASNALQNRGVRVVHTRFGMVLGSDGGGLQKIVPLYKLGAGARLGSGKQWISWIARDDLVRAISYILKEDSIEGAVNVVSPNPVRQIEFSKTLAELLHRPHFLCIPKWALRLFLGQTADEMLLSSIKAIPSKFLAANFPFYYPEIRSALSRALQIQ